MFGFHSATNTEEDRVFNTFKYDLPKLGSGSILDLGCSYGLTTKEISKIYSGCEVIGIDIQKDVIEKAVLENNGKNISYVCQNGYTYFLNDSFDIIFAMNNLYYEFRHPKDNDPKVLVKKCLSMLKNNGFLLISNKNFDFLIVQKVDGKFNLIKESDRDIEFDILDIWDVINSFN